jgi:hypothetical protein
MSGSKHKMYAEDVREGRKKGRVMILGQVMSNNVCKNLIKIIVIY